MRPASKKKRLAENSQTNVQPPISLFQLSGSPRTPARVITATTNKMFQIVIIQLFSSQEMVAMLSSLPRMC